jgi:putative hydrolase of the HAD superfamily
LVRTLNAEVVELAKALRPRYTVALLSNADDRLETILHERYGIAHLFNPLIVSAKVGLAKPDPAIYTLAAERSGVPPACCVFIDDFRHNAEGARAVGMHGITFTTYAVLADELRDLGVQW